MADYSPPVSALLTLGQADPNKTWPNYLTKGFGPEHVPALLRMIGDEELDRTDQQAPAGWAPVHAWRVLGQLRAIEAAGPLLDLFAYLVEHYEDWPVEEL